MRNKLGIVSVDLTGYVTPNLMKTYTKQQIDSILQPLYESLKNNVNDKLYFVTFIDNDNHKHSFVCYNYEETNSYSDVGLYTDASDVYLKFSIRYNKSDESLTITYNYEQ